MVERLLTTKEVTDILNISSVTLWRLIKKDRFPKPLKLSAGSYNRYKSVWVDEFIAKLEA